MQLYAVDQVSISSVQAESLRPGDKFTVSAALGEELLKKLPKAVSLQPPAPKEAPISVKAVFDKLVLDLAAAEHDAGEKTRLIGQSVIDAQTSADAKIIDINASVDDAQANADTQISAINASVVDAQTNADAKIIEINASVDAARAAADAEIKKIDDAVAAKKAEPAPLNKSEQPPKNK